MSIFKDMMIDVYCLLCQFYWHLTGDSFLCCIYIFLSVILHISQTIMLSRQMFSTVGSIQSNSAFIWRPWFDSSRSARYQAPGSTQPSVPPG